jgi:hypothetical protein
MVAQIILILADATPLDQTKHYKKNFSSLRKELMA